MLACLAQERAGYIGKLARREFNQGATACSTGPDVVPLLAGNLAGVAFDAALAIAINHQLLTHGSPQSPDTPTQQSSELSAIKQADVPFDAARASVSQTVTNPTSSPYHTRRTSNRSVSPSTITPYQSTSWKARRWTRGRSQAPTQGRIQKGRANLAIRTPFDGLPNQCPEPYATSAMNSSSTWRKPAVRRASPR